MSINTYTGLQGSGKSYEVVLSVIIPAISKGRRVVTNIDGIDSDAIRAYIHEKQSIPMEKLGFAVHVDNSRITEPNFFPCNYHALESADTVVKCGDLVAIDEAWRFWGVDCKISEEHRVFFREHRHFVDSSTGVACDLVFMVQDISDIHRILKVVIEMSFRTHKAKALGMNNVYNVSMWEGYRQHQKNVVQDWMRTYDKNIFPLYRSYASDVQGQEVASDSRQNIFADKRLIFKIVFFLILCAFCVYRVFVFFNDKIHPADQSQASTVSQLSPSHPSASVPVNTSQPLPEIASRWRIVGLIEVDGFRSVVLESDGAIRLESITRFTGYGSNLRGIVDGQEVTRFSGSPKTKSQFSATGISK